MSTRMIPIKPDTRGYTDKFECSECKYVFYFGYFDTDCDYNYCPYCGEPVVDEDQNEKEND